MSATESINVVDPSVVGVDPKTLRDYEDTMKALVKSGGISGCASTVLRGEEIIHSGAWGKADIEAGTSFNIDTMCRMVCATKTYVAIAFMTLVEEGRASPNDRLDKYVPAFKNMRVRIEGTDKTIPAKRPILIKHLMAHTSGIGYSGDLGESFDELDEDTVSYTKMQQDVSKGKIKTAKQLANAIAKIPLAFQPGYKYTYSYSFDVLGHVLEVISGKRLDKCLEERIFKPMGMKATRWAVADSELSRLAAYYAAAKTCKNLYGKLTGRKSIAKLYRIDGRTPRESNWHQGRQASVLSGGGYLGYLSGGLVSTVRDTTQLVHMLLNYGVMRSGERLLKRSTVIAMEKNRLNERTSGTDKVCYLGNIGTFREGADEFGMGGAACTYWNIDREDKTGAVWFTQNVDMPEFSDLKGVNPKTADLWAVLHKAVVKGSKRKQSSPGTSSAKRVKK